MSESFLLAKLLGALADALHMLSGMGTTPTRSCWPLPRKCPRGRPSDPNIGFPVHLGALRGARIGGASLLRRNSGDRSETALYWWLCSRNRPIATNKTPEGREKIRRVEFVFEHDPRLKKLASTEGLDLPFAGWDPVLIAHKKKTAILCSQRC